MKPTTTKGVKAIKAWQIVLRAEPKLFADSFATKREALAELATFGRPKSEYRIIPVLITPIK